MTQNRRIAQDIAVTYGRFLYVPVIVLFGGLWTSVAFDEKT